MQNSAVLNAGADRLAGTFILVSALFLASCAFKPAEENGAEASAAAAPITLGNGTANWIVTEGLTREGATFTFREVRIDGDGWLVFHPFSDGRPVGDIYVASSFLNDGANYDVQISVDEEPASGTMFLVMLHRDVNANKVFDFVFVDERNVLDKAVFEGNTMIAHAIAAP